MVCTDITRSDAFLEMGQSARLLYYDLLQEGDDEGFVDNPKTIMRMTGAVEDDLRVLIAKKFVILPDETKGVVVIKHWFIHNYIRKDRMVETNYKDLRRLLGTDENGSYTMSGNCLTYDGQMSAQDKISKDKTSKDNIRHQYGSYRNVLMTDDELEKLKAEFPDWQKRIERVSEYCASTGKTYKNYLATIRAWARKEAPPQTDKIPVYDGSRNVKLSDDEINELLSLTEENDGQKT